MHLRAQARRCPAVALVVVIATLAATSPSKAEIQADAWVAAERSGGIMAGAGDAPAELSILATNNDGVDTEGLAVMVDALAAMPNVRLRVVAPVTDQTSTGSLTTPGLLAAFETTTAHGHAATAVHGFSADSVVYALRQARFRPHVVVSGVNDGQNLGPIVEASGTVGAARVAARRGVPGLAVSFGLAEDPDFQVAAVMAVEWLERRRDELSSRRAKARAESLNVPNCTVGTIRGTVRVPIATSRAGVVDASDCESTLTEPRSDVEAFRNGYATLSRIPLESRRPPIG